MYPTDSETIKSKFDDSELTTAVTTQDNIKFEEVDPEAVHPTFNKDRRRRFSIHSKDDGSNIFTINEKVKPEVVLPTIFKTVSHKVDNEIENDVRLESTSNKFSSYTYHTDTSETIAAKFSTSLESGLTGFQYQKNAKEFGPNVQSKPPSGLLKKIFMYFFGGFGALLLTGGILCIICWKPLGDPPAVANLVLGVILIIVFILQALFNFFQDFSSSRVMDSIHDMIPAESIVIRDGAEISVPSKDITVGDLVKFSVGSKIPADIRIIDCSPELAFDRSVLTGESKPIPASTFPELPKTNYLESNCIAMQGTFCVNGSGRGIVVSIGDETIFGSIAKMTSQPKKGLTPLQYEILRFVALTSMIIVVLAIVVIILWAAWLRKTYPGWISVPTLIVDIVSVAVAFIPEGLPIALTTCLIITANEMRKNKILCKSLAVVETLGSISVLCFDKTGTLTKNAMIVTNICKGTNEIDLDEVDTSNSSDKHLLTIASLCNESSLVNSVAVGGNATDRVSLQFVNSVTPVEKLKAGWAKKLDVSFNSKDKFMMSLYDAAENDSEVWSEIGLNASCIDVEDEYLLMVKGAPDILLEKCGFLLQNDSTFCNLTNDDKMKIQAVQQAWSSKGKRVILLASKLIPKESIDLRDRLQATKDLKEGLKNDLIFIGMLGIEDPPRKDIDQVIDKLRQAGIKIIMITGDYELTGLSIAKQCGIVTTEKVDTFKDLKFYSEEDEFLEKAISITGPDMNRMDEAQWENLIKYNELVFTRTTPEQKLLIIKQFQKYKQIIGMTGDGINDAPSLKQADIGISIADASDIAKEASDLILMNGEDEDHLFFSIIEALRYGRLVFENLKKTIGYLLPAGTYSELWPVLLNVIFGMPQMLSSFCMIIICCLTDCIGAIVLAYETNERNLLSKKPRSVTKERLVDFKLLLHSYFIVGTFYTFTSMLLAFLNLTRRGIKFGDVTLSYGSYENIPNIDYYISMSSSIYFVNLVIMQLFNLMAMRTRYLSVFQHSPWKNKRLFMVMPIALAITFIINYIPGIQKGLGTAQVPVEYYFISVGFGATVLLYDELRKLVNRKYPKGFVARWSW
ncbi:putative Ca2+ ATPase [Scheffersomyces xylosifermentans]|uniref:putative Ca2+ ATPase n=1 Tax=Scheffersomyces xylosifermentans TaxID=1304137 RepID=UPI00315D72EB